MNNNDDYLYERFFAAESQEGNGENMNNTEQETSTTPFVRNDDESEKVRDYACEPKCAWRLTRRS